jgi:hypothetical protein
MTAALLTAVPKPPEPVRSEAYRRYVAQLACRNCGVEQHSQAAHPNSLASGASGAKKASDILVFPLCTEAANACHKRFDSYILCTKKEMPFLEIQWTASTQYELIRLSQESGASAAKLRALLVKLGLVR